MTEEKQKREFWRRALADSSRVSHVMVYGCPVPPEDTPAHVDPSPTIPPQAHDELGPVAELRPDGQGGRAPELPRVNLDVLRAACGVQGWKISAADDGSWFVMTSEQASVRYESPRLPQMTARGPFDEVLDMIAVVAAAAIGKP